MDDPIAVLPAGEPPGFPACGKCPYGRTGPAWICVSCAGRTLEAIAPVACPICSQRLDGGGPCRNSLCRDPSRRIDRIDAIAYFSGSLEQVIRHYKYGAARGWSVIFGRLVVGWLETHLRDYYPPDLIVANPTYVAPGLRDPGHIETIISQAAIADYDGRWNFDTAVPAAIIKTQPTEKSAGRGLPEKRAAAAALRKVLRIPYPARIQGRHILVVDDVCTTGHQLDAVADCLLTEGRAARVRGLVLARAPWQPKPRPEAGG
jgi:predicted amidophosphoribosyltransferase